MENNWKCPVCKQPVIVTGQRKYETLVEHVSDPNMLDYPMRDAHQCSDENCITRENDIFWDDWGGRYGMISYNDDKNYFINSNDAPFGSHERKTNVEIYKKGLKEKKYLHPALFLWIYQPMIEYNYKSNTDGDVLKRSYSLRFLKKDGHSKYYSTYVNLCWGTWKFLYERFKDNLKSYKKTNKIDYIENAFSESFNRAWVYRWFEGFIKIRYYRYYKLIK